MILSSSTICNIRSDAFQVPDATTLQLPEKVLQFGTGVLLRGLPDYFIDKANRAGKFNGRVVVVKSTAGGELEAFAKQDSLYTICVRGIDEGASVSENIISAAVSRVLVAKSDWEKVLALAASRDMKIVISNTTEVGIALVREPVTGHVPQSFPGKLLAFLFERYKKLGPTEESGMIIIPTELIVDNGKKLQSILNELAIFNAFDNQFIEWLNSANTFCSSLVDRIVPGKPSEEVRNEIQQKAGYTDDLMIMAEVYRLWAIQGDEKVKQLLEFAEVDAGVIIEPDIDVYRELKLRMLNGTHTLSCGLAVLAGFETVKLAMTDTDMSDFIASLMLDEISAGIPYRLEPGAASAFGRKVLDRFRNPFIEHKWLSITVQFTSKMKMRNVPVLVKYVTESQTVPLAMALGFAAYILFMKSTRQSDAKFYGSINGLEYQIQDDQAAYLHQLWQSAGESRIAATVLRDENLWGTDLSTLPGFEVAVTDYLAALMQQGGAATLEAFQQKKMLA